MLAIMNLHKKRNTFAILAFDYMKNKKGNMILLILWIVSISLMSNNNFFKKLSLLKKIMFLMENLALNCSAVSKNFNILR